MLLSDGYRVVRDWLPTAIAFVHSEGRGVDLHPVELTADGGGDQVQLEGTLGGITDRQRRVGSAIGQWRVARSRHNWRQIWGTSR
jgi:hypothetical protein